MVETTLVFFLLMAVLAYLLDDRAYLLYHILNSFRYLCLFLTDQLSPIDLFINCKQLDFIFSNPTVSINSHIVFTYIRHDCWYLLACFYHFSFVCMDLLILNISHKRNYTVWRLCNWFLPPSMMFSRFIHPVTCQSLISLYGQIILHGMNVQYVIYPFISWGIIHSSFFVLFLPLG